MLDEEDLEERGCLENEYGFYSRIKKELLMSWI